LRSLIFGSDALAQQFSREPRICRSLTEVFGPMWLVRVLRRSDQIARDHKHAPSAGGTRENEVERILEDFLPEAFGVVQGFIFSSLTW
jgi:hypothetical protein